MTEKCLSELELIRAFEDLSLPEESFNHREHVRLAWALLRGWPRDEAFRRFAIGLKRFAAHHGAEGKYHETITFFFLHLVERRMRRMRLQHGWGEFARRNTDLVHSPGFLLKSAYWESTLESRVARGHFVLPDREPGVLLGAGPAPSFE